MAPTDQWSSIIDKTIESKSYVAWYRNCHSLWFTGVSHSWSRDTSNWAIPSFRPVNHNCLKLFDHSEVSKSSRTFGRVHITAFLADGFVGICEIVCTWFSFHDQDHLVDTLWLSVVSHVWWDTHADRSAAIAQSTTETFDLGGLEKSRWFAQQADIITQRRDH
jgi:hypothetical protein